MKFKFILTGLVALLVMNIGPSFAQNIPQDYPSTYQKIITEAKREGHVSLYSTTDEELVTELLEAFKKKYDIAVDFTDVGTIKAYSRIVAEVEAEETGADIVWSSAMDLQLKLASGGYTETYQSPEKKHLPEWASYNDMVYATTVEPIGVIYNTKAFPEGSFPKTRAGLIDYLNSHAKDLEDKVATYDPEKSGIGFLIQSSDATSSDNFWELAKAMGDVKIKPYMTTAAMRDTVISGENLIAINVIGSYALDWAKTTPDLGVAFGEDYTAAFSRPAVIARGAPHPNAARLFLDFMLSKEGQTTLSKHGLPSVRTDIDGGHDLDSLNAMVGGNLKPISLDDKLLYNLAPQNRVKFFRQWNGLIE